MNTLDRLAPLGRLGAPVVAAARYIDLAFTSGSVANARSAVDEAKTRKLLREALGPASSLEGKPAPRRRGA